MNMHRRIKASAAVAADNAAMPVAGALLALTALAALALMPVAALGADAPASAKEKPVKVEKVNGASFKRVTLTAKAAQRLGIKAGVVGEKDIPHTRMMGGLVLPVPPAPEPVVPVAANVPGRAAPAAAAAAAAPQLAADGKVWISVVMSQGELSSLALDRPARVKTMSRAGGNAVLSAMPSKLAPILDPKREMLALHYVVQETNHGLHPLERVLVELQMSDHGVRRTVVPTSAVFHEANGAAFVYLNPAPLTYMREPVTVARIVGDVTALSKGPPVGTVIVTVGAPLLYGAETLGK